MNIWILSPVIPGTASSFVSYFACIASEPCSSKEVENAKSSHGGMVEGIKEPSETTFEARSHQDMGLGSANAKSQQLKVLTTSPRNWLHLIFSHGFTYRAK